MGGSVSRMDGEVVWVVGASSGLGAAYAEAYARRGATVVVSARREDALHGLVGKIKASGQGDAVAVALDASQTERAKEFVEQAVQAAGKGRLDVVVLCAGISNRGSVAESSLEVLERVMQINFFAHAAIAKEVLPHFLERSSGRFVVIGSVQSLIPLPQRAAYAASKGAQLQFFESLRAEVAHRNIHVNVVAPGYVKTEISMHALKGDGAEAATMDANQANGFSAEYVVEKSLREIEKHDKRIIVVAQTKAVFGIWLYKHFPGIYAKFMDKRGRAYDLQNN